MTDRVLLLIPTTSYKAADFMEAAERIGVEVVVGTDRRQALERTLPGHTLTLDFADPERRLREIVELAEAKPLRAVIGVDDETTPMAALASEWLGLPHNPEASVRASRDKYETRRLFAEATLRGPRFRRIPLDASPGEIAREVGYPCVLKPIFLSASRGVLRADDRESFVDAFRRIAAILRGSDVASRAGDRRHVLVEDYLPGDEVALEGLLEAGRLPVLALFDKPDPLEGPTFEETLFVTPSRYGEETQRNVAAEAAKGCSALGLRDGPVHAELRLHDGRPWLLEVAPRTIGGLCSRALRFGAGVSLEELVLLHALGRDTAELERETVAAGVMMIPVPAAGRLRRIEGVAAAREVAGIEEVTISAHVGAELVPLPEGHRYVGFIFARGDEPAEVEALLRRAHSLLRFEIESCE
jgi:biotin carboxylase